jgi:hypothetical protein
VLVLGWSYAARTLLPLPRREPWPAEIQKRAPPLARYDSGWYLTILERGYGPPPAPGQVSPHAFFPLFPMLSRGIASLLGMDGFAAGQVLSIACFLAAGLLFAAEGRRRLGARGSRDALLFLLLYPTAFFFVAMYSESLFLLLALAALGSARRDRPAAAALFGLLAGTTRLTAIALAAPLAIEAFSAARTAGRPALSDGHALRRALLAGLAPAAGVGLWVFGSGLAAGEPGLFFRVQEAWNRGVSPLLGAWHFVKPFTRIVPGQTLDHPALFLDYGHFLLFAAIGIYQARRRRFSDAAWTAGALLIPVASGVSASLSRYVLVVYPAFYSLAEIFQDRPRLRLAWWIGSAALLLAAEAAFVQWRWVA